MIVGSTLALAIDNVKQLIHPRAALTLLETTTD